MGKKTVAGPCGVRLLKGNAHGRGCNAKMIVVEEEEDNLVAGEKRLLREPLRGVPWMPSALPKQRLSRGRRALRYYLMAGGATSAHEHLMHSISAVRMSADHHAASCSG